MKKIKMILGNSFKSDIRVLKEARTLVQNGYEVEVLAWDRENELLNKEYDEIDGIKIKRFFPKAKYGSGKKQIFSFIKFIFEVRSYLKNKDFAFFSEISATVSGGRFLISAIFSTTYFRFVESFLLPRFGLGARYGQSVSMRMLSIGIAATVSTSFFALENVTTPPTPMEKPIFT